jgi:uncharacterized Zn finger protein (UPF0148 family)
MTTEIKPCPFCGYEFPIARKSYDIGLAHAFEVYCPQCDIHFQLGTEEKHKRQIEKILDNTAITVQARSYMAETVGGWNQRVPHSETAQCGAESKKEASHGAV